MLRLASLNRRALIRPHCSEVIKDVFTIADDLKIFCSDVDALGVKFMADRIMTATFLSPLVAFAI